MALSDRYTVEPTTISIASVLLLPGTRQMFSSFPSVSCSIYVFWSEKFMWYTFFPPHFVSLEWYARLRDEKLQIFRITKKIMQCAFLCMTYRVHCNVDKVFFCEHDSYVTYLKIILLLFIAKWLRLCCSGVHYLINIKHVLTSGISGSIVYSGQQTLLWSVCCIGVTILSL